MKKLVLFAAFVFIGANAFSSHLRCGYITVTQSNCNSLSVSITVTVLTNDGSEVRFGEDAVLTFGDGKQMIIPGVESTPRPDLGTGISIASFTIDHVYSLPGSYLIGFVEPNRNGGVINMSDSFYTTFYTETRIEISTTGCTVTPAFMTPPAFRGNINSDLQFSLGTSSFNNLVTYELATPKRDRYNPVQNFVEPPNMQLNALTGLLRWNTEGAATGEYNFAVVASQWTLSQDQYRKIGYVRIDFQVILHDDDAGVTSHLYDNEGYDPFKRVLVKSGEEKEIEIFYNTNIDAEVELMMFSELTPDGVSFSYTELEPGRFKGLLKIQPSDVHVREHGYLITIRSKRLSSQSYPGSISDLNYLIYTDEILNFPVAFEPEAEPDLSAIDVFPNPFAQELNVRINHSGKSEARLFTTQGTEVKKIIFQGELNMQLTDLVPGIYICEIRNSGVPIKKIQLIKR